MSIVYAHKGKVGRHVRARGLNAHGSLSHQGVNAVEAVGESIAFLMALQRNARDNGPFNTAFEDPTYASIECCMVGGGTAINVIPASASFDFDIRYLPGEEPEDYLSQLEAFMSDKLEPEMQAVTPQTGLSLMRVPGCAAFWRDPDEDIVGVVRALFPEKELRAAPFGTEAGYFRNVGIPTLVCGPGSIDQAHKPDEFVTIDQVTE
ncbi:peptidase dimerization domain-containing protein [Agrobacterium sp. rho-8.1]|nr:peptidase dimerization domain-containing protein [Agrobacterium sp. rho-8.1]